MSHSLLPSFFLSLGDIDPGKTAKKENNNNNILDSLIPSFILINFPKLAPEMCDNKPEYKGGYFFFLDSTIFAFAQFFFKLSHFRCPYHRQQSQGHSQQHQRECYLIDTSYTHQLTLASSPRIILNTDLIDRVDFLVLASHSIWPD